MSARAVCEVPAASPVTAQRRSARRPCTRTPGRCAEPVRGGLGHVLSTRSRARAAPLYGAVQDGHIRSDGTQANGRPGRRWGPWGAQKRAQQMAGLAARRWEATGPHATAPGRCTDRTAPGGCESGGGPPGCRGAVCHACTALDGAWTATAMRSPSRGGGQGRQRGDPRRAGPSCRAKRPRPMTAGASSRCRQCPGYPDMASSGPHGDPARWVLLLPPFCERGN